MVDTNTKQFSCFKEWLHAYLVPHLVIYIPFLKDHDGNDIIGEDGQPKKDSEHIKGIDTGWKKWSYDTCLVINDMRLTENENRQDKYNAIIVNLRAVTTGVRDADTQEGEDYLGEHYPGHPMTISFGKRMPHQYFTVHPDDPAINLTSKTGGWKPGIDVVYDHVFEDLEFYLNDSSTPVNATKEQREIINFSMSFDGEPLPVFTDFPKKEDAPVSVSLPKNEQTFDPKILELIDAKYFGAYSDCNKIIWGICYCWPDEANELSLKYCKHKDYTESQTVDYINKSIKNYQDKGVTYGTLCYYAKQSDPEGFYDFQRERLTTQLATNMPDMLKQRLKNEFFGLLVRCDDEIYYKGNKTDVNFSQGEKRVSNMIRQYISKYPDKFEWFGGYDKNMNAISKKLDLVSSRRDAVNELLSISPINNRFITDMIKENVKKVWFNDGYYDFNKRAFIPQTTESTLIYIDRPMHMKVNKKKQQEIIDTLLFPILNKSMELVNYYLWIIRMAMSCDISYKKFYEITGLRDCGKSKLIILLQHAFEKYTEIVSGQSLYLKRGDVSTKDLAFLIDTRLGRILNMNENTRDKVYNGSIIKSLCSGGDTIKCRHNFKEDVAIEPKSTLFMWANDTCDIQPIDTCEKRRQIPLTTKFITQEQMDNPTYLKRANIDYEVRDGLIDDYVKDQEVINQFVLMIFNATEADFPLALQEEEEEEIEGNIEQMILNDFEYSKDSILTTYKIKQYIKDKDLNLHHKKIRDNILGLIPHAKKDSQKGNVCIVNVILKEVDEE